MHLILQLTHKEATSNIPFAPIQTIINGLGHSKTRWWEWIALNGTNVVFPLCVCLSKYASRHQVILRAQSEVCSSPYLQKKSKNTMAERRNRYCRLMIMTHSTHSCVAWQDGIWECDTSLRFVCEENTMQRYNLLVTLDSRHKISQDILHN